MKLSPPASSSDLEVAREIARRLHQRRRREDRPGERAAAPTPPTHVPPHRAAPPRPAANVPPPPPAEPVHLAARPVPPPPAAPERSQPSARWADEPAPPSWDSISVDLPSDPADDLGSTEPEDALDALTAPTLDAPSEPAGAHAAEAEPDEDADPRAQNLGPDTFDEADAYGGTPQASPFDEAEALGTPGLDEPELETPDLESRDVDADEPQPGPLDSPGFGGIGGEARLPEEPAEEEELFDDRPGPSWGDVVEGCMSLAHARGALLADAAGELVAARGEWPDPGADAIASRLVAMMDRTLKDAPTRSVSAPVGGLHLTAWRVPVGDRLLTAAFIADSPVRAETRPSIDLEVQRGAAV